MADTCTYCGAETADSPAVTVVQGLDNLGFCSRSCHEPWAAGDR